MTTGSTVEECYQRAGSYFIHTMTYTDTNKQLMQYTFVPVFLRNSAELQLVEEEDL